METLLTYFIKVSVLISLFYLSYHFLLKRETFFSKNRLFLLLGLVTSVVLPMVTITKTVWIEPEPVVFEKPVFVSNFSDEIIMNTIATEQQKNEINWIFIVAGFYVLGMLFFLVKFILSSLSLYKILHKNPFQKQNGFRFIDSKNVKTPFSFFNYIAFDSSDFSDEELQNIITHEKVHSNQKHSLDILFSELFLIAFWFNPFVWLYKKAILQNLEFIADNQAVKSSKNKVNYQKTLLKVTLNPNELALANSFFQPLIKKRIIMLNKNQSKNRNLLKYAFILPVLTVFVMQFQTKVVAQEKGTIISQEKNISEEQQYKLPTSVDWEYAKDVLILQDTIVWVKDFTKNPNEYVNQSTGEKIVVKGGSWEDVKEHLEKRTHQEEKPLIIINGKEVENQDILSFGTKGTVTHYDKESAVKKFGEKGKNGAIVVEGKDVKITSTSKEIDLIKFLKSAKNYNKIEVFDRWGNLVYTLKSGEKLDEKKLNSLDEGTYFYTIENKSGENQSSYLYKGDVKTVVYEQKVSDEYNKAMKEYDKAMIEYDKAMKEYDKAMIEYDKEMRKQEKSGLSEEKTETRKKTPYEERWEREKQAQEKSGLSDEEIKVRGEKLKQKYEERQQKIEERNKIIEERRKEYSEKRNEKISEYKIDLDESFSIINKNTTDLQIKEYVSKLKSQNIEMKVSNLKRNKNGEIIKIKISLLESSGTKNNKKESKAESTIEYYDQTIPNIYVGKRNGELLIESR